MLKCIAFEKMQPFLVLFAYISVVPLCPVCAQGIVPDNSTDTKLSIGQTGTSIVSIAPKDLHNTSLNRYSDFNVLPAGVHLDNQSVHAATIVNEVTGTRATRLEGPLAVLGPPAHVVVANPNGITVNGVQFFNVGGAVLATGSVGVDMVGRTRLSVERGTLAVEAGGLSGLMTELDLLAKEIRVSGPIRNEHTDATAKTSLVAGRSTTVLSADVAPGAVAAWATTTSGGAASSNERAVDISQGSLLSSGAIRIHVTDAGAGVRISGDAIATGSDIRIDASGAVRMSDAKLAAHGAVAVSGKRISVGAVSKQSEIRSSTSGVSLEAGQEGIELSGVKLAGVERDFASFSSMGGITLSSAGGSISLGSGSGFDTDISASRETVAILAGRKIESRNSRIVSAQDVLLSAGDDITSTYDAVEAARDVRVLSGGSTRLTGSNIHADADIRLDSSELAIMSTAAARSEVVSRSGAVFIGASAGGVVNVGGLVEGKRASLSDPEAAAAVTVNAARDVVTTSVSNDRLGVFFGRDGDLVINAGGRIENRSARLFSNANVALTAGESLTNVTARDAITGEQITSVRGNRSWRTLWLSKERRRTFSAGYGHPLIADELALVTAIGDVNITAPIIENMGGQISGNDVSLSARDKIVIESLGIGDVYLAQSCGLISCWSHGTSATAVLPGSVSAAGKLKLAANGEVRNLAGRLVGSTGLEIEAPIYASQSLRLPFTVLRPSGLTGMFSGHYGWLSASVDSGFLSSPRGSIHIATAFPVALGDTETLATAGVLIDHASSGPAEAPSLPLLLKPMSVFGGLGL